MCAFLSVCSQGAALPNAQAFMDALRGVGSQAEMLERTAAALSDVGVGSYKHHFRPAGQTDERCYLSFFTRSPCPPKT
jgi:hypothetical protein